MFFLFTSSLELVFQYSQGFLRSIKNLFSKAVFSNLLLAPSSLAQLTSSPIPFAAQAGNVDVFDSPFPIHLGLQNLLFSHPLAIILGHEFIIS